MAIETRLAELADFEPLSGFRAKLVHTDQITVAHWTIDAGSSLPEHSHPQEMIVNMMEGEFGTHRRWHATLADRGRRGGDPRWRAACGPLDNRLQDHRRLAPAAGRLPDQQLARLTKYVVGFTVFLRCFRPPVDHVAEQLALRLLVHQRL